MVIPIWVTDYNPYAAGATWTNTKSTGYNTFMDRNLGALDNTFSIASRGLFYQWGRKDPVPATKTLPAGYSFSATTTPLTVAYSIQHPEVFIRGTQYNFDWCNPQDDTLWGDDTTKSVYDPCPTGWRVPVIGTNTASPWFGLTNPGYTEGGEEVGVIWDTSYWPATGYLNNENIIEIGRHGGYWCSGAITYWGHSRNGRRLIHFPDGELRDFEGMDRGHAFKVRCVSESIGR